jgi:tetratricopeptide (TPR) repeat protein
MQRLHLTYACTLLGVTVLVLSGPAWAQQPAVPAPQEMTQQPAAQHSWNLAAALFAEGTKFFKQWRFDEAEQKFREALTHREHPIIHIYLSRALEKQGRLVEAHEALRQALRPGAEPLPPEDVQVADVLQKSLESRLAQFEAHCDVPGAKVSLDGEFWFVAPGRERRMVSAGQHVIIARKSGYFSVIEPVSLIPGKQTRVVLRMTADVVHLERRWRQWLPRAVAGTGIAMAFIGGVFLSDASADYAALQDALDQCTRAQRCARIPHRRLDRAKRNDFIGTGALIAGGTALAAGLAGMFLNLPRTRRSEPTGGLESLDIAPMISGDTAGISARIRF